MEEVLNKLNNSLKKAFQESLKPKEIYLFDNSADMDVFKTLMFLKKNSNDLNKLMLQGAVSNDELIYDFGKEIIKECLDRKYIIRGNSLNSDKIFIGSNGMYKLYMLKDFDVNGVFIAFDSNNFIIKNELTLKPQEKIWCIFLILFGADRKENLFNSEGLSIEKSNNFHKYFISIEHELVSNGIYFGKKIGWETGKDSSFRKFITNIVDLSKTTIYFNEGKYKYYLDLSKRKNANYLLDLILDKYQGENRLTVNDLFYNSLKELSFKMTMELGEMPGKINKHIIEALKG